MKKVILYVATASMIFCNYACNKEEYTVSFECNGGTPVPAKQTVKDGGKVSLPQAPERDGYIFEAWYKETTLTNKWKFDIDVVKSDVTLYADWSKEVKDYTVSFESNGGMPVPAIQTVKDGGKITEPAPLTLDGYTFDGWYEDIELTQKYDFTTPVTADFTLYAKWTLNEAASFTVTFNSNGGSEVADQNVISGDKVNEPTPPTKQNFTFDGWYEDIELTQKYDFETPVTADLILYAKWNENMNTSGTTGSLTWVITDGKLIISGTDEMPNYDYVYDNGNNISTAPWFKYRSFFSAVVIEDGVTSIGNWSFAFCNGLTSTIFGKSIMSIGEYAFYGCSSLTELTIPNSVTSIKDFAFGSCNGITSVTIPNSVTEIGSWSFSFCSGLTSVTIPNSVTEIGYAVFHSCRGLTSVTIPNSVTSIRLSAFENCSSLTEIAIPNSVIYIGSSAFWGCSSLTEVTIPNSVTYIGSEAFRGCSSLTTVNFNAVNCADMKRIQRHNMQAGMYYTFYGCNKLTTVNIGSEVTRIPTYAFSDCSGLTGTLSIPNSVTSIGEMAFYNCSGLTSVSIGNSVTTIERSAFANCSSLTGTLSIPNSVTTIEGNAFAGCSGLTAINVDAANSAFSTDNGVLFNKTKTMLILYPANKTGVYTIPNSVTSIGSYAFTSCIGLTSVTIPNSVVSIGDGAFYYCSGLTSIIIPSSVTVIEGHAFANCSSLTGALTIPNSVTSIGYFAFQNCTGLTSITIPNSVASIGDGAFCFCTGLTEFINYATTPHTVDSYTLYFINKTTCTLRVPAASVAAYKAANFWKEFVHIVAIE